MAKPTIDVNKLDVLQAQINVSISQARELVSSWLPPAPAKPSQITSAAQVDDDDNDLFKPLPPHLGLGAPIPQNFYDDDNKLRKDISSAALLRRRLLNSQQPTSHSSDKTPHRIKRHQSKATRADSDSEEELGRSALGKSKRQKVKDTKSLEKNKEAQGKVERGKDEDELGKDNTAKGKQQEINMRDIVGDKWEGGELENLIGLDKAGDTKSPEPKLPASESGNLKKSSKKKRKKAKPHSENHKVRYSYESK